MYKDLVMETETKQTVLADHNWHDAFGWNAGGGATVSLGHKRELFLEARAINFMKSGFENGHQLPLPCLSASSSFSWIVAEYFGF